MIDCDIGLRSFRSVSAESVGKKIRQLGGMIWIWIWQRFANKSIATDITFNEMENLCSHIRTNQSTMKEQQQISKLLEHKIQ